MPAVRFLGRCMQRKPFPSPWRVASTLFVHDALTLPRAHGYSLFSPQPAALSLSALPGML